MPRLGLGSIDLSATTGGGNSVTGIDDFFFESFTTGQMHPIRTSSRTNLVLHSENFDTSGGWGQDDATIDPNSTTAPDGTLTADKIIGSTVSSRHNIVDTGLTNTVTASISVHAKAGELRYLQVASANTTSQYANFDLLTGTIGTIGSDFANVAMDSLANGWYRITLTSVGKYNSFYLSLVSGLTASWLESWSMSNNTDGLFLWGAQLEEDGFASAYIPTSGSTVTVSTTLNDTSNVWDFDGTDIMIAEDPEDEGFWEESYPDGASLPELVLNGDYEELGNELVTNGDFSTAGTLTSSSYSLGWSSPDSGISISSGVLNLTRVSSGGRAYASNGSNGGLAITSGKTYQLTYTITENTDNSTLQYHNGGAYVSTSSSVTGTYTVTYVAAGTIFLFRNNSDDTTIKLDNVSLKQVDPNGRWIVGDGWSIENGKAVCDGSQSGSADLIHQNLVTQKDVQYEITYTVSNYSAGTIKTRLSSGNVTAEQSSNGTFTEIITAAATGGFRLRGNSSFVGSVDNVSIKQYAIQPLDI